MSSFVIIKGKKYKTTDANAVIESNTNEDLHNHFYGNSIDAKWTRHINYINEQIKNTTEYKAGRPAKNRIQEQQVPEMGA